MTTHITARLAWHDDGWNGHVCRNPTANTYCVGRHSYPGEMIAEKRDLKLEAQNGGKCISTTDHIPPCIYSVNAFGAKKLTAFSDPPGFFKDGTRQKRWDMPPATVSVWPYEEMYKEGVKDKGVFDYAVRMENARAFFADIENDKSLIFYYANYSNPFSEGDQRRYVLVGLSRVNKVGEELFFEGCSEETKKRYAGGFVWQRNITSHYPDEGLRIPYHRYRDQPDVIDRILLTPENPRNCKYASRRVSDDEALGLVEQFLSVATTLQEMGDTSEDWTARTRWLQSLIGELWESRGLYPGLPQVLELLNFEDAIPYFKEQALGGKEREAYQSLFGLLDGKIKAIPGLTLDAQTAKSISRQWRLRDNDGQTMLRDVLPRLDLAADQMEAILSVDRAQHCVYVTLPDIAENPYLLAEEYVGDGPDDIIPWSAVDRGVFPSPDLGGEVLGGMELDDWRRLRALCVERIRRDGKHTFLLAAQVLRDVNQRLDYLPEWKRTQYKEKHFEVDEEELSGALTIRREDGRRYLYLKTDFEDERLIEDRLKFLVGGPDIKIKSPVTAQHWRDYLYDASSALAKGDSSEYQEAIRGQAGVCQRVFTRPLSVLSGAAGTGKTTVIKAIIKAVKKGHGVGAAVVVLAPTGKAADRIRGVLENDAGLRGQVETATIHSFLAKKGWLNPNMTFKREGGAQEGAYATYVVDESSMLDLSLAATLFKAIHWASIQRFILVGDPNQLPPIGRGRVFADIIDWLEADYPESVARLSINLRQLENRINKKGAGILDLAELYLRDGARDDQGGADARAETMLQRVQEGGDIDHDLRALYWSAPEDLARLLIETITADMALDTKRQPDPERPYELWSAAFNDNPEYMQILTPYRGELFGIEALNSACQKHVRGRLLDRIGSLDGITLFDKVIQVCNRPRSRPIHAYNVKTKAAESIEVFNGELGFVKPHGFDGQKWQSNYFWLKHFQVVFARKRDYWVGYGRELGKNAQNRWLPSEPVEENLELAYAVSVHKAQGSEFERVYIVIPKSKKTLLSPELLYTALTRATRHCTLLIEQDVSPLLDMRRPEKSHLLCINSSLFRFRPVPDALLSLQDWYEEGKIHRTLAESMVRSKSEVIIANMLFERDMPFMYEAPLFAPDGTFYLPDFTITWRGEKWYWEHLGRLDREDYRRHWEIKKAWYEEFFPDRLVTTSESGNLSLDANKIIDEYFSS